MTPACSTCGMAVEWIRSCYSSEWQLFRNSNARTKGRYYFCDDATPFYPKFHNLASRSWNDANWTHNVVLGEVVDAPQQWYSGDPPVTTALARAVGSADCIQLGEASDEGVPAGDLVDGFVSACMVDEAWARVSSYMNCTTRRVWASLIMQLYAKDDDSIRQTVVDWIGDLLTPEEYTVFIVHHAGLMPGIVAIITPGWTAFGLDGTHNFQELALQAFAFALPPTNYGILGTVPLWYQASSYVLDYLAANGTVDSTRVMCVGHSYGGAAALVTAARLRNGDSSRELKYLTFGSPKIGNESFRQLVRGCRGWSIANDDDLVSLLPPDAREFTPILPLIAWPLMTNWGFWLRPPGEVFMNSNGVLFSRTAPFLDTQTLYTMAERAFHAQAGPPIGGHLIPEYLRRHERACPAANWPVDEPTNKIIWLPEAVITFKPKPAPSRKGALVFTCPPPATPCHMAINLAVGTPYAGTTNGDATQWFRFDVEIGTTYHMQIAPGAIGVVALGHEGTSCEDELPVYDSLLWDQLGVYCYSWTATQPVWWVDVGNVDHLTEPYTLLVDVGPC